MQKQDKHSREGCKAFLGPKTYFPALPVVSGFSNSSNKRAEIPSHGGGSQSSALGLIQPAATSSQNPGKFSNAALSASVD
jgi:hypothetical protein